MTLRLGRVLSVPIIVWSVPEPSAADSPRRLKLNSLCGANLAAYALNREGHPYAAVYDPPSSAAAKAVVQRARALAALQKLKRSRILVVGKPPKGFYPCEVDDARLATLLGPKLIRTDLRSVFTKADKIGRERVEEGVCWASRILQGLGRVPRQQVEQSVRAELVLLDECKEASADMVAVECLPDFVTTFGGAACWAMSRLTDRGVMGACETDVYGAITMFLLRGVTGSPPFFADLAEVESSTDTATFWHCGMAPVSLARPNEASASIHPNRKVGLTVDFGLIPGKVTIARLGEKRNSLRLFLTTGEALDTRGKYLGTSMVVRLQHPARQLVERIFEEGLEHHFAISYGDASEEMELVSRHIGAQLVRL